jgi:hypothetical protein
VVGAARGRNDVRIRRVQIGAALVPSVDVLTCDLRCLGPHISTPDLFKRPFLPRHHGLPALRLEVILIE